MQGQFCASCGAQASGGTNVGVMDNAPKQVAMDAGGEFGFLAQHPSLLVKQTMRGCLQECMGCEAKSEYKVSEMDFGYINDTGLLSDGAMSKPDIMYLLEESSFCMRCCWQEGRALTIPVTRGPEAGGEELMRFEKPMGCQICLNIPICVPNQDQQVEIMFVDCPMCCMLPMMETKKAGSDEVFSKTQYVCDMFLGVPKFDYYEGDQVLYRIAPETCCGGCCMNPRCCRARLGLPFYFYDPNTGAMIDEDKDELQRPQITKVWAGLKKECCSTADNFAVFFPEGCDNRRKAGMLGATMLIDLAWFEGHD
jgi:hypothetical protein